jgi:hypothetical protein
MQRVGGVERWNGQWTHEVASQPAPWLQAGDTGAAAEAGHSLPGRQSRSVIAEPSGHHWTIGSTAANASGTTADAKRRPSSQRVRIRVIFDMGRVPGVSPRSWNA